MRFHLIDRIDSWDAERQITARKVTAAAEDYWSPDRTGSLLMPPELVLEAVCQAATWLIMLGSGFRLRAVLLSVDEIGCTRDVVPGDVLAVTATVASLTDDGRARRRGRERRRPGRSVRRRDHVRPHPPPDDQLPEVDGRSPHLGRRRAEPARRPRRHPPRHGPTDDQPGGPRPGPRPRLRTPPGRYPTTTTRQWRSGRPS
jgi:3-hydroxyacyl-[acyl-carrier-protein] dehydratase